MSVLQITELSQIGRDSEGKVVQSVGLPIITSQEVSYTGTHGESAAFNSRTKVLRLVSDGTCRLAFGTAPVATAAAGIRLPAEVVEYYVLDDGIKEKSWKVSAVTSTA